jgi:hypothetical protein
LKLKQNIENKHTNMKEYNLKHLVKIEVRDFSVSNRFYYQKKKTFFGITIKEEGVYFKGWNDFKCSEIPKEYSLIDGVLHLKPEVTLYFQSDIEQNYYFDSLKEANDFKNNIKILSGGNFISSN